MTAVVNHIVRKGSFLANAAQKGKNPPLSPWNTKLRKAFVFKTVSLKQTVMDSVQLFHHLEEGDAYYENGGYIPF